MLCSFILTLFADCGSIPAAIPWLMQWDGSCSFWFLRSIDIWWDLESRFGHEQLHSHSQAERAQTTGGLHVWKCGNGTRHERPNVRSGIWSNGCELKEFKINVEFCWLMMPNLSTSIWALALSNFGESYVKMLKVQNDRPPFILGLEGWFAAQVKTCCCPILSIRSKS